MSLKTAFLRGEAKRIATQKPPLTENEKKTKRLYGIYNRHAQKLAKRLDRELTGIITKNYGLTLAQLHPRFSRPRMGAFDANITYYCLRWIQPRYPKNLITASTGRIFSIPCRPFATPRTSMLTSIQRGYIADT